MTTKVYDRSRKYTNAEKQAYKLKRAKEDELFKEEQIQRHKMWDTEQSTKEQIDGFENLAKAVIQTTIDEYAKAKANYMFKPTQAHKNKMLSERYYLMHGTIRDLIAIDDNILLSQANKRANSIYNEVILKTYRRDFKALKKAIKNNSDAGDVLMLERICQYHIKNFNKATSNLSDKEKYVLESLYIKCVPRRNLSSEMYNCQNSTYLLALINKALIKVNF